MRDTHGSSAPPGSLLPHREEREERANINSQIQRLCRSDLAVSVYIPFLSEGNQGVNVHIFFFNFLITFFTVFSIAWVTPIAQLFKYIRTHEKSLFCYVTLKSLDFSIVTFALSVEVF